ncbi:MAG: NAD(P)-binding protein, partial [Bacteroidetes bacterium]|nr:NAD(P)-binding protein [Bacteroidota bacterium]
MDSQAISQERIMRSFDYLIVGAGFSGCILAERIASVLGRSVLLIDRRDHIGGNAADVI